MHSRAVGRRVYGHVGPKMGLRRPRVATSARAVDIDDRKRATRGHHMKGHGLARHNVHHVSNVLRGEDVRSKGNQATASYGYKV